MTSGDSAEIAAVLGYPRCCAHFFDEVWATQGFIDTTWAMAQNTPHEIGDGNTLTIDPVPESNILLRWIGVRAVPHLPCRFDCPETVALARRLLSVGERLGYQEEVGWMRELLQFPVEWSALHGIAEIKLPILKVTANTDATAGKSTVRLSGSKYPELGAQGLHFPYDQRIKLIDIASLDATGTSGKQKPSARPHLDPDDRPAWEYGDNGFSSLRAMDRGHTPIVSLASLLLEGVRGPVLDLGCGNARLLHKICDGAEGVVPYGVDSNGQAIRRARELFPNSNGNFVHGDMFDELPGIWRDDLRYELVLLMPGRLIEARGRAGVDEKLLVRRLRSHAKRVLIYAYRDVLSKYGELESLVEKAGLQFAFKSFGPNTMLATMAASAGSNPNGKSHD